MWDQDPGILLLPLSLLLPIRVQFQGLGPLGSTSPPPALTSQPIFLTESRHASQRYCAFSLLGKISGGKREVWGGGVPGPAVLRLPSVGSRVPLPAASRNLSGSLTLLPLPTLFQGGVCGVETRTRLEEVI